MSDVKIRDGAAVGSVATTDEFEVDTGVNTHQKATAQQIVKGGQQTGNWTPTDASGAALSLTTGASNYVKVGRMVFAWFSITYPVTADGTTSKIGGLPFTSEAVGLNVQPVMLAYTETASAIYGRVLNNTTTLQFSDSAGTTPTNATMSAKLIRGMAIYSTTS